MKSDVTSKQFPADSSEWERVIAEAPGEDRPAAPAEEAAWSDAIVVKEGGYPKVRAALEEKRRRGPNKQPIKEQVAIRISPEVLAYFRSTGRGWQTRMDEVLKEWVRTHR
jgi:uncharacterized protein (DUF4415 family)